MCDTAAIQRQASLFVGFVECVVAHRSVFVCLCACVCVCVCAQVLVAARQPLDTGLIDTLGLTDALSQLPAHGTLFYTDHHTLYTVHPYVIEYLMDKETAGTWYADVAKGHRQLATALLPYAM